MFTRLLLPPIAFCFFTLVVLVWPPLVQADEPLRLPAGQTELFTATTTISSSVSSTRETEIDPGLPPYIKGLYMTYHAAGHQGLRSHALDLIDTTELNALVLDIKGDLGVVTYKSEVITATTIGANDAPTIRDWQTFMQNLKKKDIYAIARIVVFKDNYLARAHPEWAVIDATTGELWLDREELPWLEPFHEQVWDYNIALAVEAARRGFDEIQFDYVRFPTDGSISNIAYSQPADTPAARTQAINGFLAKAQAALEPYPVKLAVDVFGYTTWHKGDFRIGQDLSQMAAYLDVLSPMFYPSTYDHGLPNMPEYDFAVAFPYQVVYQSMLRAMARVKSTNPDIIVRPWIQDFPDYQFDRRIYTPDEVRAQMFAAYDTGAGGWMLWDPRVKYTPDALVTADIQYPPNESGEIMILRYENFGHKDGASQRSLTGFRRDLEQLWAAGYYPVNLRDLVVGDSKYQRDLERLAQDGWPLLQSKDLLSGRLNYVPSGKRPVVLTFDGSHISQYRLLADGSLDPNSAVGVLYDFHLEHPADWPMRATFFVQPEADDPAYLLFGQPEFAEQKLQNLVEWGMEVGSYTLNGADLSQTYYKQTHHQLGRSQALIEAMIPDYQVDSVALPFGKRPRSEGLLRGGLYDGRHYQYDVVATYGDEAVSSPHTAAFDPYRISRIQATTETVEAWLEFYKNNPATYYVASGTIPQVRPADNQ